MFFGCRSMCEGKKPFLCKRRWLGKYETKLSNFGTCFSGLRMTARRERKRVKEEDKRRRSMDAQKRNEMKLENVVLVVGWKITRIVTLHNWYYELCTTTSMALRLCSLAVDNVSQGIFTITLGNNGDNLHSYFFEINKKLKTDCRLSEENFHRDKCNNYILKYNLHFKKKSILATTLGRVKVLLKTQTC